MLSEMRSSSGSFIIWILFAFIIASFVLFFGPQSDRLSCGGAGANYSIQVADEDVPIRSWRFAYNASGRGSSDVRRVRALEILLFRELFAQVADSLDIFVPDSVLNDQIAAGKLYFQGTEQDVANIYFENSEENGFFFDAKRLERWVQGLGLESISLYREEQRRELAAYLVYQEFLDSATASDEEARFAYVQNNTTVSAEYVKFATAQYRTKLKLTDDDVHQFMKDHEDELKAEWEQVKPRWESEKPRVRGRLIRVTKTKTPEVKPATARQEDAGVAPDAGAGVAATADNAAPDPARVKLEAARASIEKGAEFAELAKELSEDRTASLGGNFGWRAASSLGFGQEVVDATKELAVGTVSPIIETSEHYFVVLLEERSDKPLTFEQKKFDLAVSLSPTATALAQAKAAAQKALSDVQTTPLSELFAEGKGGLDGLPPELLAQMSPTDRAALQEQLQGDKPTLQKIERTTRNRDMIAGVGRSKELVQALFDDLAINAPPSKVFELADDAGYVLVRLTDRTEADMEAFEKEKDTIKENLAMQKASFMLATWIGDRCTALKEANQIVANPSMLRVDDGKIAAYEPCSTLIPRSPPAL